MIKRVVQEPMDTRKAKIGAKWTNSDSKSNKQTYRGRKELLFMRTRKWERCYHTARVFLV